MEREVRDATTGKKRKAQFFVTKTVSPEGNTSYDFTTHDTRGQLIRSRLMPDTAPVNVRGKPFAMCEHIEHLRHFFQARGANGEKEFMVMAKPSDMDTLLTFIKRSERNRRQQEALFAEVVSG